MKHVIVSLRSTQRNAEGEDTVVEYISPGLFGKKNDCYYIMYEESEATGLEGVHTIIKATENRILIIRNGDVQSRHCYELNHSQESLYRTPFGELTFTALTHEMSIDISDEGLGHIHLGYDISIGGTWQFYNQLDIELREDSTYGHEGRA